MGVDRPSYYDLDIVDRLRSPSLGSPRWMDTMDEAADEIERLKEENRRQREALKRVVGASNHLIQITKAALKEGE